MFKANSRKTEEKNNTERVYHLEQTKQICADNKAEADRLYTNYLTLENANALKPPEGWKKSEDEWLANREVEGYIKQKLGEEEEEFYFEYLTSNGAITDLVRIYKCGIFNPGGRSAPEIFLDENTPKIELGVYGVKNSNLFQTRKFVKYLALASGENCKASLGNMNPVANTFSFNCEYFFSGDWGLPGRYIYFNKIYTIDPETGVLTLERKITGTKEGPITPNPLKGN